MEICIYLKLEVIEGTLLSTAVPGYRLYKLRGLGVEISQLKQRGMLIQFKFEFTATPGHVYIVHCTLYNVHSTMYIIHALLILLEGIVII